MTPRVLLTIALLALAPPVAAGGEAPDDCGPAAALALQKRYDGVRDVRARFEQSHESVLSGQGETSRGQLALAKPGKMRWSYEEPEPSLVVSDGETLWLYDPAFGEVQKLPATEGFLTGATAQFLLGAGDLQRDFAVRAESCTASEAVLELVPKAPAGYEKLFLEVDPRTGDIRATRVVDLLGNVTRVRFSDLQTNTGPPASSFHFDPPEGVEVIELRP